MSPSPKLVFSGAATIDMIFSVDSLPTGPGKIMPKAMVQAAHGMATSAAIAARRLGGDVSLIARIGNDLMGDQFLREVMGEGVDCAFVRRFDGVATPLSAVVVDAAGERLVLPYYDKGLGADPAWIPEALVQGADGVQVDVRWPEGAERVLSLACEAGKIAVLDADIGPVDVIDRLAKLATHTVFSAPAALKVAERDSVVEALAVLTARYAGFIAITDGADGCYWQENGALCQLRPPRVDSIDTLAAGDVFHGAFTLAIAEGQSIREAIAFANVAAALKCKTFGGRLGAPHRDAVLAALAD
ncbi:sugar kinase [Devosia sp. WQ 349]|uniref:PfkB family carbohydrate kinase n=1 Tax=Devosia sp. WQ 349K1 TaxID=2800329 RepID=UPI001907F5A7|nr:PfkB family carbohydrate kinase [Devosia sp. WQ 349K1]MBK1795452.1 sugar kinase [Devosia sp. WQ 349K1]